MARARCHNWVTQRGVVSPPSAIRDSGHAKAIDAEGDGHQMKLFRRAAPQSASNLDTELLPGETSVYVHGVTYRQSAIKKPGTGAQTFALVAEPTNAVDVDAVMVMGIRNGEAIHVGYLPAGEHSTLALGALSKLMSPTGKVPAVSGIAKKDSSGFLVDLRAPFSATTKKLVKAAT